MPDSARGVRGRRRPDRPGVGHFAATAALDGAWRDAIGRAVDAGTPLLGICLGMQWLFEGSDEAPEVPRPRRAAGPRAGCSGATRRSA